MFAEPWRVVLPAILFFAVMSVISWLHSVVLAGNLESFCTQLRAGYLLNNPTESRQGPSCRTLYQLFSLSHASAVPASTYQLTVYLTGSIAVLWTLSLVVMLARVVCVVDFQLVRMRVRTIRRRRADTALSERITKEWLSEWLNGHVNK